MGSGGRHQAVTEKADVIPVLCSLDESLIEFLALLCSGATVKNASQIRLFPAIAIQSFPLPNDCIEFSLFHRGYSVSCLFGLGEGMK